MFSSGLLLQALVNLEARTPVTDQSGDMSQERGLHHPDQGMPKFERQIKKPYPKDELETRDAELPLLDREDGTINYETTTGSGLTAADPGDHRAWLAAAIKNQFGE